MKHLRLEIAKKCAEKIQVVSIGIQTVHWKKFYVNVH